MTVKDIYKANYETQRDVMGFYDDKYTWAARQVFDLTTYDGSLDERFVKDILEVCKVILENRNFEYIKNEDNYVKYILVCQLLNGFSWIEWGTSIRGAWFDIDSRMNWKTRETTVYSRDILEELEWWEHHNEPHVIEAVPFTVENLIALIEFMEEIE